MTIQLDLAVLQDIDKWWYLIGGIILWYLMVALIFRYTKIIDMFLPVGYGVIEEDFSRVCVIMWSPFIFGILVAGSPFLLLAKISKRKI